MSPIFLIYGVFGALIVGALALVGLYNGLVSRRNAVSNAFGSLDANLQKRFDLIPNLVATVKSYMTHERETLEALSQLRAGDRAHNAGASAQLIGQIMARAEAYPQLMASANFLHLQRALTEIEEQISASRRAFNAAVADYNNAVETFPGSVVALSFGFARDEFYSAEAGARAVPSVGELR